MAFKMNGWNAGAGTGSAKPKPGRGGAKVKGTTKKIVGIRHNQKEVEKITLHNQKEEKNILQIEIITTSHNQR